MDAELAADAELVADVALAPDEVLVRYEVSDRGADILPDAGRDSGAPDAALREADAQEILRESALCDHRNPDTRMGILLAMDVASNNGGDDTGKAEMDRRE